ncbi:uncharacterized protein N7477_007499 [Penicillium maclennaniae]|uniref:uncharacterized protein n=1 Tax=Penicillium maclennaniae TaxID=1343394 RepID=UPI002540E8DC|nr:uncharacterized protein N7477_007499 [Penicillium maclennaniae]KAJ5665051.1 hypothetical protein N7477_007499 [Penicillium maclennaniae]
MSLQALLNAILGLLALYITGVWVKRRRALGPLPPGPPPRPIVGNIADLPPPGVQDWMHWLKHKDLYGPISSVTVMGQTIVILNDIETASELLRKRASIYSSRPHMVFASEMVGWGHALSMQPYTDRFRAYRKLMKPYFGSEKVAAQYIPLQEVEAHRLLWRILKDQGNLTQHIQTEAGAVILKITYGYRVEPHKEDLLVNLVNVALEQFGHAATPGTWLVDIIPALKYVPSWFPGAGFKRTAQEFRKNLEEVAKKPYALVQQRIKDGRYKPSFLSDTLKLNGIPPSGSEEELVARWTTASLYGAGADTTVSSVGTFFLAMALYPEVQKMAQDEIDRVIGPGRLPTAADRDRLPYVNAMVKEIFRWHPVVPMGIPHMSTADDIYEGYYIPKGSLILPNIWGMMHDPALYHDPMAFKPERFLEIDGRTPDTDPHSFVFGFGRRVCPGRILADSTVWLSVAKSLAVFKISKPIENGVEVDIKPEFQPGVISHPVPCKLQITPRSAAHEELILAVEQEHPWEQGDGSELQKIRC